MIDYYAPYTPYAMLLIAGTVVCILLGALICAFGAVKLSKGLTFWLMIVTFVGLLCLPVLGFFAFVSPSIQLQQLFQALQRYTALSITIPLLGIPVCIHRRGLGLRWLGIFGLVFLVHFACVICLWGSPSGIIADYFPILDYSVFSMFLIMSRQTLFVEFSPVSLDNFMQEIDDMILIFDRNMILIDANAQVLRLWPFLHMGMPMDTFFNMLKEMAVSVMCSTQSPLIQREGMVLSFEGVNRSYHYDKTNVKDKKGNTQAIVLNFSDVTERSWLERELTVKNSELEELNNRLQVYLDIADRLIEEEQKAKVANRINELVGERIADIIAELETVSMENRMEKLPYVIDWCRETMAGVRLAMGKLMGEGGKDREW